MHSSFRKAVLNVVGVINVVMGIIGIFLPIWPTTIFVIIASICFARANPRLHNWLVQSKFLGPYLDNFHNKRGIAMAYKIRTALFMWAGMTFSMTLIELLWVQIMLICIGVAVTAHVFAIKTNKTHHRQVYGLVYNLVTVILCWVWLVLAITFSDGMAHVLIGLGLGVFTLPVAVYATISRYKQKPRA